ncbi:MAG: hypothetical protein H0W64_02940 [Gammaproteobacteria bacterium]|nr:hypothetical protein [Gammaproteobacteria bacterium]
MPWLLAKSENQFLTFVNENKNADINKFILHQDVSNAFELNIYCKDQGAEKILSRFGTDRLIKNFLNSKDFFGNIYRIKDGFLAENVILAINAFYYISKEHRALIRDKFNFPNLFFTDGQAGEVTIALAMKYGFEKGYQFAKKELKRTNNESSCMNMLAEHKHTYAKEIARRKCLQFHLHLFKHKSNSDMDLDIDDNAMAASVFAKR